ncbi:MAG: hypothetical protein JXR59_05120 [Desulfuromonadaceae bacterium]|nr:hypothetical protein [Desulfuromonadaceae bacterium]
MPYGQAKELLEHARKYHKQVAEFYQKLADMSDKPRVVLMLDYLVRHEKHLEKVLAEYETGTTRKAMDTWFQFSKEDCTFQPLNALDFGKDISVEQILEIGSKIDQCLLNSYKAVADRATTPEVREIFENLLQMETQERHVRARNALGLQDM